MKKKVEIEVNEATASICRSLGISVEALFEKVQTDLIGSNSDKGVDDTMLLHLYLAQTIAKNNKLDRSKVEDFLTHVISLKAQFDQYNYTYIMDEAFSNHQVICEYCRATQLINTE